MKFLFNFLDENNFDLIILIEENKRQSRNHVVNFNFFFYNQHHLIT